jgi:hypothetical protein
MGEMRNTNLVKKPERNRLRHLYVNERILKWILKIGGMIHLAQDRV